MKQIAVAAGLVLFGISSAWAQSSPKWVAEPDPASQLCMITSSQQEKTFAYVYAKGTNVSVFRIQDNSWNFTDAVNYQFRVIRTYGNGTSYVYSVVFSSVYGENYLASVAPAVGLEYFEHFVQNGQDPRKLIVDFEGADDIVIDQTNLAEALPSYVACIQKLNGGVGNERFLIPGEKNSEGWGR